MADVIMLLSYRDDIVIGYRLLRHIGNHIDECYHRLKGCMSPVPVVLLCRLSQARSNAEWPRRGCANHQQGAYDTLILLRLRSRCGWWIMDIDTCGEVQ